MVASPSNTHWADVEIDFAERRLRSGIGELAAFHPLDLEAADAAGGGRWRRELGRAWHASIQGEATAGPVPEAETIIQGTRIVSGWTLQLQGRIDQVIRRPAGARLVEIKTVDHRLPLPAGAADSLYPRYWLQLALYRSLAEDQPLEFGLAPEAVLLLIDIQEGVRQELSLEPGHETHLVKHLDSVVRHLERRRVAHSALRALPPVSVFEQWREGQEFPVAGLRATARRSRHILFEAPTGFGKTGTALAVALDALREGRCQQVVIVTAKASAQEAWLRELGRLYPERSLRWVRFRSREDQRTRCLKCSQANGASGCGGQSGPPDELAEPPSWDEFERAIVAGSKGLESLANQGEHCLYAITRAALSLAPVWIGDYNYVFSPFQQEVFNGHPGFDPARTLLVVDEAHQLPERVAGNLSRELDARRLASLIPDLLETGAPGRELTAALESLISWLAAIEPSDNLDGMALYELEEELENVCDAVDRWLPVLHSGQSLLPGFDPEPLYDFQRCAFLMASESLDRLAWSPERGRLRIDCVEAPQLIGDTLRAYGQSLLLSATLRPLPEFIAACGLEDSSVRTIRGEAPWRENVFRVAADLRVDTRYHSRDASHAPIASSLAELSSVGSLPVAAFFPSFAYAESVRARLDAGWTWMRSALQPRGGDRLGQQAFMEQALREADILFLVMGSVFSESIDALGGSVSGAVVVSPALPEVNALREYRRERLESLRGREEAFRQAYWIPGIRRINQALGRLVRAPGQRAWVLLVGRRFAEATSQDLLEPEYRPSTLIRDDEAMARWISDSSFRGNAD